MRRLASALVVLLAGCSAAGAPVPDPAATPITPAASPTATPTAHTPAVTPTRSRRSAAEQARLDSRLQKAAWANDVDRARRLIAAGADVNAKDETEQSAYLVATSEGYLELLELALDAGGDVAATDSYNGTGLIRAADRGHAAVAGRLVQARIAVDHVNRLGWTALHEAIILGDGSDRYVDTVRVLVTADADLRLPSRRDGVPPLAHAETRGHDRISALLRAALADDTTRTAADPALLAAAARGDADGVAIALRAGASPSARDSRGRSVSQLAQRSGEPAVLRLLEYLGHT